MNGYLFRINYYNNNIKIAPIIIAPKYLIGNDFIEIILYIRVNNGCYYRRRNYNQSIVSDW